jgi:hypothetical protein
MISPTAAIEMIFSTAIGVGEGPTAAPSARTLSGESAAEPQPSDNVAPNINVITNDLIKFRNGKGEAGPRTNFDAFRG